ncbi:uncharacterized protein TNIN_346431 [Trichonephila inaurata madagascariensis]|uniref:Uncharacterized protein n=1 Tax=Trichonephila inaurata madagascariensis TaxID=2747483 RepID=A0A8X7CKG1_9ARAC|nr:uncharacterized protein TNIN_346431 [Trichonephila inaurata madagascariensis]
MSIKQPGRHEKWNYPYLDKETDSDFRRLYLKRVDRPKVTSGTDPCSRLYHTPTLSSLRRCNKDKGPPVESLDLCLGSACDQTSNWPIDKTEAVRQPVTQSKRCLCRPTLSVEERPFDHPLRIAPFNENLTDDINGVKLSMGKKHLQLKSTKINLQVKYQLVLLSISLEFLIELLVTRIFNVTLSRQECSNSFETFKHNSGE